MCDIIMSKPYQYVLIGLPGKQKVFPSNLRDKCVTVMKTNKGENINNNLKSSIVLVQVLTLKFRYNRSADLHSI
jgi:hypothetical protein